MTWFVEVQIYEKPISVTLPSATCKLNFNISALLNPMADHWLPFLTKLDDLVLSSRNPAGSIPREKKKIHSFAGILIALSRREKRYVSSRKRLLYST
jgi:hypothetical protein